nr:PREDICTED: condensin-2 complex subunit D3-like [Latimeria chalumnae]|eukprot:XP_006012566.2 PREDICTED: condensin-2 complex subunit D3-like [Latimeria chalumnae]
MANRLERELLERIRALWLETIPPVWVDTVWELDFTETEQLDPHIEQEILENGLEVFTELYSSLLPFAVEEQSTGPGRDLWILFAENGISHNTLVAVLYHFIQLVQNKKASVEQREYSLYAAGLYFLLLEIPGSIANRVLHPVLFDKSLDTLKKSWPQDVDLRRKRKKDTMKSSRGDPKGRKRGRPIRRGYSEMDDIFEEEEDQGEEYFSTQGILQIREAIFLLLKNFLRFLPKFSLKDKPQSLQHCLQILIEMTRFEPVTGELYFLVEINEIKSLPVLAYHGLLLLCSPFHGEGDKTLRCVFHRILNVILMMEGGERSNLVPHTITQQVLNAREQAVEFVSSSRPLPLRCGFFFSPGPVFAAVTLELDLSHIFFPKTMFLLEDLEKKAAPGFRHCSLCASPFPATDKCLGPEHRPRDCDLCRSMGNRALRNVELRFRELFGSRSVSSSLPRSSRYSRTDCLDPRAGGSAQSSPGPDTAHRSAMASKASRKAYLKLKAPVSATSRQMLRAAPESRPLSPTQTPGSAEAGDAPVSLHSGSDTEPEASTDSG